MSLKQVAIRYIQGRQRLKELRNQQQDLMHLMGDIQKELHDAFGQERHQLDSDSPELTSFTLVEGNVCYTFIFSDGKLQSLVEGSRL